MRTLLPKATWLTVDHHDRIDREFYEVQAGSCRVASSDGCWCVAASGNGVVAIAASIEFASAVQCFQVGVSEQGERRAMKTTAS